MLLGVAQADEHCARAVLISLSHTDRKSTRLNSSHGYISYAVFCLKKKNYARCCATISVVRFRECVSWDSTRNYSHWHRTIGLALVNSSEVLQCRYVLYSLLLSDV